MFRRMQNRRNMDRSMHAATNCAAAPGLPHEETRIGSIPGTRRQQTASSRNKEQQTRGNTAVADARSVIGFSWARWGNPIDRVYRVSDTVLMHAAAPKILRRGQLLRCRPVPLQYPQHPLHHRPAGLQEGENWPNVPLQEKFHTGILQGLRNIPDTL